MELLSVLNGTLDLTTFDYKTGQFCDSKVPPIRIRARKVSIHYNPSIVFPFLTKSVMI